MERSQPPRRRYQRRYGPGGQSSICVFVPGLQRMAATGEQRDIRMTIPGNCPVRRDNMTRLEFVAGPHRSTSIAIREKKTSAQAPIMSVASRWKPGRVTVCPKKRSVDGSGSFARKKSTTSRQLYRTMPRIAVAKARVNHSPAAPGNRDRSAVRCNGVRSPRAFVATASGSARSEVRDCTAAPLSALAPSRGLCMRAGIE